jgi:hypothetical protein
MLQEHPLILVHNFEPGSVPRLVSLDVEAGALSGICWTWISHSRPILYSEIGYNFKYYITRLATRWESVWLKEGPLEILRFFFETSARFTPFLKTLESIHPINQNPIQVCISMCAHMVPHLGLKWDPSIFLPRLDTYLVLSSIFMQKWAVTHVDLPCSFPTIFVYRLLEISMNLEYKVLGALFFKSSVRQPTSESILL